MRFPVPITYNADLFETGATTDFLSDRRFQSAYEAGIEDHPGGGFDVRWRVHVVLWAAAQGLKVEGDFVECGVYVGLCAKAIYEYLQLDATGRRFWLCDTYEGLAPDDLRQIEKPSRWQRYDSVVPFVTQRFSPYAGARVVVGPVPDTLDQVKAERVAYLSIDMNCVGPEIAAGEHFWPKLSPGAVVVLDDYGFPGHEPQRQAWDAFAARHDVMILNCPTGQGLIIKPS